MKRIILPLVAVSLALNVVLLGVLLAGRRSTPPAPPPAPEPPVAKAPSPPVVDEQTWSALRADIPDLPAMVQRLRESGFPPEMVRAIVGAQLRELYAARIKALDPDAENRPFWKNYSIDPKVRLAQSQLYREQQKLLRQLLGADAESQDSVNALYRGQRLDSVPPDKVDDVMRVHREFDEARSEIYSQSIGGLPGQDMQKRLVALDKQLQESLATVLTPRELEDFNLRNSDTARNLRGSLSAFNPTEEEFRMIYQLQAPFDERFGRMYSTLSVDEQQQRSESQRQVTEQIKAALGPVRAAEYERATDYSYRQTSQLVTRLELPPDTTTKVWEIQKDLQSRIGSLYQAGSSQQEREARFAALEAEAQTRIAPLLGARGFEAYKQYGGSWMQSLRPRPPTAAKK